MMLSVLGFLGLLLLRLLAGVLLVLLCLTILVLVIPFRYDLRGHRNEADAEVDAARDPASGAMASMAADTAAAGTCDWLYGLISIVAVYDPAGGLRMRLLLLSRWVLKTIRSGSGAPAEGAGATDGEAAAAWRKKQEAAKQRKEAVARKKAGKAKHKPRRKFRITREKVLLIAHAGIRAVARVMPERILLDVRIGFDDPGDTGTLCAVLGPLHALFRGDPVRYDIRIVPVFEGATLLGALDIKGRIHLWFIVWEALKLAISRPFRQDILPWLKPRVKQAQGGYEHV